MQARLTTVEAEEAQQKEELNTFYLMWAGTCTTAPPCCARCCAIRAHSRTLSCCAHRAYACSYALCVWCGGCAAALIFLMQAGFATLSAGSIRAKNVSNILLKASSYPVA